MKRTTKCRHCDGLGAGHSDRCPECGRWLRRQDYYPTDALGAQSRS